MISPRYTTNKLGRLRPLLAALVSMLTISAANAERVAVLSPNDSKQGTAYIEKLAETFSDGVRVLDLSMSRAAFNAVKPIDAHNMTAAESKTVGSAIGCDLLIFVKAATLRRTSLERDEYYESYAAVYTVSSRSGRLISWALDRFEGSSPAASESGLMKMVPARADEIEKLFAGSLKTEASSAAPVMLETLPAEGSPEMKNLRAPIPYKRIRPEYTSLAYLYDVAATVEIEIDLAADGKILRTEIVRWAGFGLDEAALSAVREMNWRPAERNGKPLSMRVLLRYNFKKIEK